LSWAKDILNSKTHPAYFKEPGYAYIIAFFLKIFNSYIPLIFLQIILGALIPLLIYLTINKLFKNSTLSFAVSLPIAFLKSLIFYDTLLLKNSLEIFLTTLIVFLITHFWQKKNPKFYFSLGILIGLTSLIRATLFYTAPILALSILFHLKKINKKKIILSSLLVLGTLISVLPATIHNWKQSKSLVFIIYGGGPNIYLGNHPEADGSLKPPEFISVDPPNEGQSWVDATKMFTAKELNPSQINSYWIKKTITYSLSHPLHFTKLTFKKLHLLFSNTIITDNYNFSYAHKLSPFLQYLLPYSLFSPFAIFGLIIYFLSKKLKKILPITILFICLVLILTSTHIAERYRLSLLPFMAIFSAYFIKWIYKNFLKLNQVKTTLLMIGFPLLFFLLFIPQKSVYSTTYADVTNSIADEYKQSGSIDKQKQYLQTGLNNQQTHIPSLKNLARIYLLEKDYDRSIQLLQQVLKINPAEDASLLVLAHKAKENKWDKQKIEQEIEKLKGEQIKDKDYFNAMIYMKSGRYQQAKNLLEKALKKDPDSFILNNNLAVALKALGDANEAEKYYKIALKIEPNNLATNYNLAKYYFLAENYEQAVPLLENIKKYIPNYMLTPYFLGVSYFQTGNKRSALFSLGEFIEENKNNQNLQKELQISSQILQNIIEE